MIIGEGNYTEIVTGEDVTKKLRKGVKAIKDAVGVTFGPYGHNVAITKTFNPPHVTKDGVTVAKDLKLEDPIENVALQIIKESSKQTAAVAGDGTTTTVLLAAAIIEKAYEKIGQYSMSQIQNTLALLSEDFEKEVGRSAKPISTFADIVNVATIASNNNTTIIDIVSKAFEDRIANKVLVRNSDTSETYIDIVDGIRMDATSMLILEEKTSYEKPKIIVTNDDVKGIEGAMRLINLCSQLKTPLIVFGNDIDTIASTMLNRAKKEGVPIDIVRSPHIADARYDHLKTLAIATGSTFIDTKEGWTVDEVTNAHVGESDSIIISPQETVILGRKGDVTKEIKLLGDKIEANKDGLSELYKSHLAVLQGKTSIIYVGNTNAVERQEAKDKIDDTIKAVEAALNTGVVPGALLAYESTLEKLSREDDGTYDVMKRLATASVRDLQIRMTSNVFNASIATTGILDPALVVVESFKNAIAAANLILTIDCVIVKKEFNGEN